MAYKGAGARGLTLGGQHRKKNGIYTDGSENIGNTSTHAQGTDPRMALRA